MREWVDSVGEPILTRAGTGCPYLLTVHVGEHLDVLHAVEIKADVLEMLTKMLL